MNQSAIKNLLYRMADDALVMGHRNSEWTGFGPTLEEDIAFSSMAQDKLGHSLSLYTILHEMLGEPNPDALGFERNAQDFTNCQFTELPTGEFDFTLARQFFFDHAEACRYAELEHSSFMPLAQLSQKVRGELKYHTMHADTWINNLANGTEVSKVRMQQAINEAFPYALGIFEPSEFENDLIENKTFTGEVALQNTWYNKVKTIIENAGLTIPAIEDVKPVYGGRKGVHSEHLQPMINEMTEVYRLDLSAEW